jgi:hypothetical protein
MTPVDDRAGRPGRWAVVVGAFLLAAGVWGSAPAGAAELPGAPASGGGGWDVAQGQCSVTGLAGDFPEGSGFVVVGVNDGTTFSANPCLGTGQGVRASELIWAQRQGAAEFYALDSDRGAGSPHWPGRVGNPALPRACAGTSADLGCSYDYGFAAGSYDLSQAVFAEEQLGTSPGLAELEVAATPWWIDVETASSWLVDLPVRSGLSATAELAGDRASLAGEVAALRAGDVVQVGVYSSHPWWATIMGGTGGEFAGLPEWGEGVGTSLANADLVCTLPGFAGGVFARAQWAPEVPDVDADIACPVAGYLAP